MRKEPHHVCKLEEEGWCDFPETLRKCDAKCASEITRSMEKEVPVKYADHNRRAFNGVAIPAESL